MSGSEQRPRPKLVVVAGPTGVGKTGLSLLLAERFGAEIINADSMQVYRYMDIGTAKPTPEERAQAVHHIIDVVDPDEDFDAARFLSLARPLVEVLYGRGTPIIVVGGTGLYLRSLLRGLFEGPGRDDRVRAELEAEVRARGPEALHARLARVDPEAAARLHVNDTLRVIRALEVFELTGRPMSAFHREHRLAENPYKTLFYCLDLPREELNQRIEIRAGEMFRAGLVDEVAGLLNRGYGPELKSMQSIGYKEVAGFLAGRMDLAQTRAEVIKHTRQFAKRQRTWFRSQPEVRHRSPREADEILSEVEKFLPDQPL